MRSVQGVGMNDADYVVRPIIAGKRIMCPIYQKWESMLKRCYSTKYQEKHPTYVGCSVVDEWLVFSNFRSWMITKDWEGKALDKDLLVEGNKVYGPDTCTFICRELNNLFNDRAAARGDLPLGVHKNGSNYRVQISESGKQLSLGVFTTPEEAHLAWRKAKAGIILISRELTDDIRVKESLTSKAWGLL